MSPDLSLEHVNTARDGAIEAQIPDLEARHCTKTTRPMSAPTTTTGSRSRPQARKKHNDDAAYFGPPVAGAKRHAVDKVDGEPRVKRKRMEPIVTSAGGSRRELQDGEARASLVSSRFA